MGKRPQVAGGGVGHHHDILFIQAIDAGDSPARELADGDDPRRPGYRAPDGEPQLKSARGGEISWMIEEAHVVNADHDGRRAVQRRSVLHVDQVRAVAA